MSTCLSRGACCATYRVSFYCGEMDGSPGGRAPSALVEQITPTLAAMRGTMQQPPRCIALRDEAGDACDTARRRHGPPVLRRKA
jgi:Fe-S-cluster containining protein